MTEASRVQKLLIAQETEIVSLKQRIETLEKALEKNAEAAKKILVETWDSSPENVRQNAARLWACLAICVDSAEDALGDPK